VLVRTIARGGLGSVWEAEDREHGARVALKLARGDTADAPASIEREAQVLGALAHPNIVRLLDHGIAPDLGPYLVMELLEGQTLEDALAHGVPSGLGEALDWLSPVALALAALHERGFVHRDVKPANVVRDSDGVVKLVDFGLVAHADGRDQLIGGRIAGTPHYLAPEVAEGGLATPASDVYALAVVAYELLTGHLPYEETTAVEVIRAKLNAPAPSLAKSSGLHFAPKLEHAMRDALSRDPRLRPTPASFVEALRSCAR